eukprot:CAMPEP_0198219304 /NCGR_PEP_ID=MMETSP1445-20131203/73563_1 /TAXON_ID=36898 /ORGANISM="Pyramimonas sp., Strain CCMP2087" /LENGTH=112 /DNA_ID=CAMNT_0043896663 /DNA_START=70 /DNA_END=405 /DNA_ORIENTATION=-
MADVEDAVAAGGGEDGPKISALQVDASILQLFWDLASLETAKRQEAASELVGHMVRAQQAFEKEAGGVKKKAAPLAEDASMKDRSESALSACAPLAAYALKRLARGLTSPRE